MVFDWVDPKNKFHTPEYYTYKLIETLLPKAMIKKPADVEKIDEEAFKKLRKFKLVELWAQNDTPRKGWLKVFDKNSHMPPR